MKPRIIAMIPARLGSQRVKKKNLRLIDGKPLIWYVLQTCKKVKLFDEIYINSEAAIFGEIAKIEGVKFYHRPERFSTHASTNDEFGLDFMENIQGDLLVQILPTSPFITVEEVTNFTEELIAKNWDTLVSVENKQIGSLLNNRPLNFDKLKKNPPSQEMQPVQVYATVLMGWKYTVFKDNMKKFGSAYHGGDGKTGYYEVRGLSTIDIDREEDFALAEQIILSQREQQPNKIQYFDEVFKGERVEWDVPSILKRDGVVSNDLADENHEIVNIQDILDNAPKDTSWSKRVINTESNSMTILCQKPGEGNRLHYHPNWNEWWYIFDGEWIWEIEGTKKTVKKGDIVFMKKGRVHKITASGNKPAIRFAVSRADVPHIYPEDATL